MRIDYVRLVARGAQPIDLDAARRLALAGIVSNDWLAETLVLKGGNALRIAHGLQGRASLDLDFSMAADLDSVERFTHAMFGGIRDRFDARGLVVFDEQVVAKPHTRSSETPEWWGGYEARFKFLPRARAARS